MIKSNNGNVQLNGTFEELLTDFTMITRAIFECMTENHGIEAEEVKADLLKALEDGFKDSSELIDELYETAPEVIKTLLTALDALADHFTKDDKKEGEK